MASRANTAHAKVEHDVTARIRARRVVLQIVRRLRLRDVGDTERVIVTAERADLRPERLGLLSFS